MQSAPGIVTWVGALGVPVALFMLAQHFRWRHETKDELRTIEQDLHALEVKAAETYATSEALREMEHRIIAHFDDKLNLMQDSISRFMNVLISQEGD